jgi:hypothetical protein
MNFQFLFRQGYCMAVAIFLPTSYELAALAGADAIMGN